MTQNCIVPNKRAQYVEITPSLLTQYALPKQDLAQLFDTLL